MSEQNKALARRFYETVFNRKDVDAIDELCVQDFVDHSAMPGQAPGTEGVKEMFTALVRAFPDLRVDVEELIAERDLVAARVSGGGTHKGELFGTAPTGKALRFNAIDVIRFQNGKAVEVWHQGDDAIGLMQLGIQMPMPPA